MAFVNEIENLRTIDYERDAVLIAKGTIGSAKDNEFFELSWHGKIIKFGALYKMTFDKQKNCEIDWKIHQATIPDELLSEKNTIRQLIYEGLKTYGYLYRNEKIKRVGITIAPQVKILEGE